jgi:hypothetical protein
MFAVSSLSRNRAGNLILRCDKWLKYGLMKSSHVLPLLFLFVFVMQVHAADDRLMSDADYKKFLVEVEAKLPAWEAELKRIDPAKTSASYTVGKNIVDYRDLALREIDYVRQSLAKQHAKHTVSGELSLDGFLRGVYDAMSSVVEMEVAGGVTASNLDSYFTEVGGLNIRIGNDVQARVELLEKGTCPEK